MTRNAYEVSAFTLEAANDAEPEFHAQPYTHAAPAERVGSHLPPN